MKNLILVLLVAISVASYANPTPPYILHVTGTPGVCQYWFYNISGRATPLLKHQLEDKQYKRYAIFKTDYRYCIHLKFIGEGDIKQNCYSVVKKHNIE